MQGFGQNWLSASLGHHDDRFGRVEAGYRWIHARRRSAPDINGHVFTLSLYLNTRRLLRRPDQEDERCEPNP